MSFRVAPRVKYIPISRFRSIAWDIIVFMIPMPATIIAIAAIALMARAIKYITVSILSRMPSIFSYLKLFEFPYFLFRYDTALTAAVSSSDNITTSSTVSSLARSIREVYGT